MKATVSLKQLRTDPRHYIRLLNSGYEVSITEHRKPLTTAVQNTPPKGNITEILKIIKSLPKIETPYPNMDTVELIKKTRAEVYEQKYQKIGKNDRP